MKYKIIVESEKFFYEDPVRTSDFGKRIIFTPGELTQLLAWIVEVPSGWVVRVVESFEKVDPGGKIVLKQTQTMLF